MSVIPSRVYEQTSISQVELASHDQAGGCQLKWWFSAIMEQKPEQAESAREGVAGHALFVPWFTRGEVPAKRSLMSKAVKGAIAKGKLPAPGPDLYVELRFDGQNQLYDDARCHCGHPPADHGKKLGPCTHNTPLENATGDRCDCLEYSAKWIPLDREQTLWHAGLPWEGFIDLTFRRGEIPEVLDHKFFNPARPDQFEDPYHFLKKSEDLINTVQLPIYVLNMRRYWPDAKRWKITHHQVSKKGVDSRLTSAIVSVDQVLERADKIAKTVERMKVHALEIDQKQITYNTKSCETWGGCPHQSICSRYNKGATPVSNDAPAAEFDLSPFEEGLFGSAAAKTPAPAADDVPPLEDDVPPLDEPTMSAEEIATMNANNAAVAADKAKAAKVAAAKAAAKAAADALAALEKEETTPPPPPATVKKVSTPPPSTASAGSVLAPDAPASKPEIASVKPDAPPAQKPPKKAAGTPPPPAAATNAAPPASTTKAPAVAADAGKVIKGGPGSKAALASMFRSIAALIDSVE